MIALILGTPESDGYLIERIIGIYDSEESIPNHFKQQLRENIHSFDDIEDLAIPVYCGSNLTTKDPIIFMDEDTADAVTYYRIQQIEINSPINFIGNIDLPSIIEPDDFIGYADGEEE